MRGLRVLTAVVVACASLVWASAARAEPAGFGEKSRTLLSVENFAGVSYQRVKVMDGDAVTSWQIGTFAPFFGPVAARMRLGVHHFVAPPVSLGLLLSYSDNDDYGTYYHAGARIGVAFPFSPGTALWLRAGASYARSTIDRGYSEISWGGVFPGAEAYLVLQPFESFGVLVGGTFETGVSAKYKQKTAYPGEPAEEESGSYKEIAAALSVGFFAAF